jgi:hypothetical protein
MEKTSNTAVRPRSAHRSNKKAEQTGLALLGMVATIFGTMAATLSVPDDPQPVGALFWPAVWCSLGLLTAPVLRLRSAVAALRAENLLMIGLVYWLLLDLLQGTYPLTGISSDDAILAFISIGAMAIGMWVGMLGTGWSLPQLVLRAAKQQFSSAGLFGAICISFFLGMFWFAYSSNFDPSLMIEALGWCRFCAPWSTGELGGGNAFFVHLQYFGYVLPSLTVLLAHRDGWVRLKAIVGTILSATMLLFLAQGGGRRVIGVALGAAVLTWLLLQNRLRPKVVVGGLIGVAMLLVSMELMLEHRQFGFSSSYSSQRPEDSFVHVDDNFLRLSQIVRFVPNVQPYVDMQPLYHVLTLPIPRLFWPGKPSDPGYNLTDLVGTRGVTLTTSIIGELYAMHGLVAVFIGGLVFGRIASMWNKILAANGEAGKYLIFGFGLMVLVAGLRSMQDLVIMSYGLVAWLGTASLLRRFRTKRSRAGPAIGFRDEPEQRGRASTSR